MTRGPVRLVVAVVAVALVLAGCSGSSSSGSASTTTMSAATKADWAGIDRRLSALGPKVGLLAARVTKDGTCAPVHEIAAAKARPIGSQFKLFVLGALAREVAAGTVSWDQELSVPDSVKSLGNSPESGALGFAPPGTTYTVEEVATKMISISDNTAADMLIALVGRDAVEQQMRRWSAHASANVPFLTTREMFMLHYAPGLAEQYLSTPRDRREAYLASSVDPLPLGAIAAGFSLEPRFIETIEWFASPDDICRAFAGLQRQSKDPRLAPLSTVLSRELGTIGLEPPEWRTVFFKGGSEPGVLTLGWLATTKGGETYVVQTMVSNPDAALAPDAITDLVDIARDAFGLLGPGTSARRVARLETTTSTTGPIPSTASSTTTTVTSPPAFEWAVTGIEGGVRARVEGSSWRPGCPVPLEDLRYVRVRHWGFDGTPHLGELVVHRDAVEDLQSVFAELFARRFPIRMMRLVDDFGADDDASVTADNTSAFNCRAVTGGTRWSQHSYGRAIDVNPFENPYVTNSTVLVPGSEPFVDRSVVRPGMILAGDAVVDAFAARGWTWGGTWSSPIDYQHFSASGG